METVILFLVLAGVFLFGFFIVDLLTRNPGGSGRDRYRRPSGSGKTAARKFFSRTVLTIRVICGTLTKKDGGA